jgi:hypothetical protein
MWPKFTTEFSALTVAGIALMCTVPALAYAPACIYFNGHLFCF